MNTQSILNAVLSGSMFLAVSAHAATLEWWSPTAWKTATLNNTTDVRIHVAQAINGSFDGKGAKFYPAGEITCASSAEPNKDQCMFNLTGTSFKNAVIYGNPGNGRTCDNIHVLSGSPKISGVVWQSVGEDALSVINVSGTVGTVTVSGTINGWVGDKVFQVNKPCTFVVDGLTINARIGKLLRQLGGSTFACTLDVRNVSIRAGCSAPVIKTDSKVCQIKVTNSYFSQCKPAEVPWGGKAPTVVNSPTFKWGWK